MMKARYKKLLGAALAITTMMTLGISSFGATLEATDAAWIMPNRGPRDSGQTLAIEDNKRTYLRFPVGADAIGGVASADIRKIELALHVLQNQAGHTIDIYVLEDGAGGGIGYETEDSWTGGVDGTQSGGNNVGYDTAPDGGMRGTSGEFDGDTAYAYNIPASNALCTLIGSYTYPEGDNDNEAGNLIRIPFTRMNDFKTALANDTNGEITLLTDCGSGRETIVAGLFNTNTLDYVKPTLRIVETGVTDDVAPDALTSLQVTSERDYVNLLWNTNYFVDFSHYNVYRSETSGTYDYNSPVGTQEDLGDTTFTDTNITYDTTYFYEVRVADLDGNESDSSPETSALPFLDTEAPPTPTNLTIQGWIDSITLTWSGSRGSEDGADLEGYKVYRSTTPGEYPDEPIATNVFWDRYTDDSPELIASNTYYYTVTAFDDSISTNESPKSVEVYAFPITLEMPPEFEGYRLSPPDPEQESWQVSDRNTIIYMNDDPDGINFGSQGDTRNATALKKFEDLDKTTGAKINITGTLELLDGYGDDNNRVGMYLFADADDLVGDIGGLHGDEEPGAIYCAINTDSADNNLIIVEGLDTHPLLAQKDFEPGSVLDDALYGNGNDITFSVDAEYIGTESNDIINIDALYIGPGGVETATNFVVPAPDFRGDYYGFASRARTRGVSSSDRTATFTVEYKGITMTQLVFGDGETDAYEQWSIENDVGLAADDEDNDGTSNLKEYAFGGDPRDNKDPGALPVLSYSPVEGFKYVYAKLTDPQAGISYTLQTTTNLVEGWVDGNVTELGSGVSGPLLFVTNLLNEADNQYIRVNVEQIEAE